MSLVRVATYNVHGCKGMDGRVIPDRPLQVLKHLNADCIALQELVDAPLPTGETLLEHWSHALGMHAAYAPAFERGGELFGNAILTKYPILERCEHDVSLGGYRKRVLLELLLDAGPVRLQAFSIHLGVSPRERALQADRLCALCGATRADVHLLLGDFNEWHGYGAVGRRLRKQFAAGPQLPTFPARAPVLGLDRIWVYPRERLLDTRVDSSAPARRASDHLPLLATIELP